MCDNNPWDESIKNSTYLNELNKVNIIGEIGINHNGNIDTAKQLILLCKSAGVDYIKIQKRTPELCVPEHQKNTPKDTPWGKMTYLEYKNKLEFTEDQIKELVNYTDNIGMLNKFFASVWDIPSVDLMCKYCNIGKIPSALINDLKLCEYARKKFEILIISTGMSSEEEVCKCIKTCDPNIIMHTNSTYPCPVEDLNLNYITYLKRKYPDKEIGYSGHEYGLVTTFATIPMGVTWIERHITLDRTMWGSDQESSIEPSGVFKLVKGIRSISLALKYSPGPRIEFEKESIKKQSLRKK